jgi:hypothetical protein
MEIILYTVVGQIAVVGMLFRWLQVQGRDNRVRIDKVMTDSYTKAETKEVIDLKIEPIKVGVAHIQSEIAELKSMVGKLLDEKNK